MALATVIKNFGKVEIASNNLTEEKTMADDSMAFAEYIRQQGGEDFLRGVVEAVLTRLMDYEVTGQIGAGLHEQISVSLTHSFLFLFKSRIFETFMPQRRS